MTPDDKKQAIFGSADGLTSTVAVVLACLIAGTRHSLLAGGFAIAIAAALGMGYSEYLSDKTSSLRRALVMAGATLFASALPVIPFVFFWRASGIVAFGLVVLSLALAISLLRGSVTPDSYGRATVVTFGGILVVSALVSIPSLIVASS
jgi:VIT1/CCC1 family predicted Fe2+/Mn2+ transporter